MSFLFDLDGTLVKTDTIYFKIWTEILLLYNITLTHEIFNTCIQGNSDELAMEMLQINKCLYTIYDISSKKDGIFNKYMNDIEIIEGAYDFIKTVKKLGYYICIVTNCNRDTCMSIIKYMKIDKYINYIVIGNECTHPKPYPDPYLKAITLLKTSANRVIIFEDSKPGLLSAKSVFPKNIVGISNSNNGGIFKELDICTIISDYTNIDVDMLINKDIIYNCIDIHKMIYNSISKKYDIKNIHIDTTKIKGDIFQMLLK